MCWLVQLAKCICSKFHKQISWLKSLPRRSAVSSNSVSLTNDAKKGIVGNSDGGSVYLKRSEY